MPMSSNPTTQEIEPLKDISNLPINLLHGPTCALLEVHNSTNVTQITLCFANPLSLTHLPTRKTKRKRVISRLQLVPHSDV